MSEYFSAMFSTKLKEAEQDDIELTNVNGDILKQLIDFCYTGTLCIDQTNVQALLEAANEFRFMSIVAVCSEYFQEQLDATNCVGFFEFSELYDLKDLHAMSEIFICQHFMKVIENDEFRMMSAKNLKEILQMNDLNIDTEECVFNALMKWIKADEDKRSTQFPELLRFVRMTQLSEKVWSQNSNYFCNKQLGFKVASAFA